MIEINRETGSVTWEGFSLHPHLAHEMFVGLYPHLELIEDYFLHSGLYTRVYKFPELKLNGYALTIQATYENNRLWDIRFGKNTFNYSEEDLGIPQLAEWGKNAYEWLKTQFGEPHEISTTNITDEEDLLTPIEIPLLEKWKYNFEWGSLGFEYDPLEMFSYIFIHYETHQQINNWDKLAQECDFRIQSEQERHGKYTPHLQVIRSLIDALSPHFEFQKVNPSIFNGRIGFSLPNGMRKALIDVRPNNATKKYKIWQHDSNKTSFVADGDYPKLIEELRLFLETENM